MTRALPLVLVLFALVVPAAAQQSTQSAERVAPASSATRTQTTFDASNPVDVLAEAARALPGGGEDGQRPKGLSVTLSILLVLTLLTAAPALLLMTTSFVRILIVLALLRQALGTQQLPPSQVVTGLALFMTLMIMAPTFQRVHADALVPLQENQIDHQQAWQRAKAPIRAFMFDQIDHAGNAKDLYLILNYRGIDTSEPQKLTRADVDTLTLIPAYMLSELKVAFLLGFRLYLPFLIIDMVVASVLISMGMLMLPPVLISLPFKLLLFVLVDGWNLVVGNLLNSFAVPGVTIPGVTS